jgi:hypothetical protein
MSHKYFRESNEQRSQALEALIRSKAPVWFYQAKLEELNRSAFFEDGGDFGEDVIATVMNMRGPGKGGGDIDLYYPDDPSMDGVGSEVKTTIHGLRKNCNNCTNEDRDVRVPFTRQSCHVCGGEDHSPIEASGWSIKSFSHMAHRDKIEFYGLVLFQAIEGGMSFTEDGLPSQLRLEMTVWTIDGDEPHLNDKIQRSHDHLLNNSKRRYDSLSIGTRRPDFYHSYPNRKVRVRFTIDFEAEEILGYETLFFDLQNTDYDRHLIENVGHMDDLRDLHEDMFGERPLTRLRRHELVQLFHDKGAYRFDQADYPQFSPTYQGNYRDHGDS